MKKKDKPIVDETPVIEPALTAEQIAISVFKEENAALKQQLEKEVRANSNYRHDGMYALFFSNNRKANEIASLIDRLDVLNPEDVKTYQTLLKTQDLITETLNKMRKDYLKIDEEELTKIEEKIIPLIEQQGKKQK